MHMRRFVTRLALFLAAFLALAEFFVFRLVLPACEIPASIGIEGGFLAMDPHYRSHGYQTGCRIPSSSAMYRWSINDDGWNSLFQYRRAGERNRPLIAMIGDSGVEGLWSDVEEHVDSWMYYDLKGAFDVYAFGRYAMPLVEIMLMMDRVDSLYRPDLFVVFVSHDALESSLDRGFSGEYHYLLPAPLLGTFLVVAPDALEPSGFARAAMRSALVRYLVLQGNLDLFPMMTVSWEYPDLSRLVKSTWIKDLLPAAGRFILSRMSSMLGDRRLLIVSDDWHARNAVYGDSSEGSAAPMSQGALVMKWLCDRESLPNTGFLNLSDAYHADYDTMGICFESGSSRHLNGYGNSVAARAIIRRLEETGALRRATESWLEQDMRSPDDPR